MHGFIDVGCANSSPSIISNFPEHNLSYKDVVNNSNTDTYSQLPPTADNIQSFPPSNKDVLHRLLKFLNLFSSYVEENNNFVVVVKDPLQMQIFKSNVHRAKNQCALEAINFLRKLYVVQLTDVNFISMQQDPVYRRSSTGDSSGVSPRQQSVSIDSSSKKIVGTVARSLSASYTPSQSILQTVPPPGSQANINYNQNKTPPVLISQENSPHSSSQSILQTVSSVSQAAINNNQNKTPPVNSQKNDPHTSSLSILQTVSSVSQAAINYNQNKTPPVNSQKNNNSTPSKESMAIILDVIENKQSIPINVTNTDHSFSYLTNKCHQNTVSKASPSELPVNIPNSSLPNASISASPSLNSFEVSGSSSKIKPQSISPEIIYCIGIFTKRLDTAVFPQTPYQLEAEFLYLNGLVERIPQDDIPNRMLVEDSWNNYLTSYKRFLPLPKFITKKKKSKISST
jgi:hypothetical protein